MTASGTLEIEHKIKRFIVDHVAEEPFEGEDPLLEGVVDSLGVEQIVEYVSEAFGVELEDEEIVYENFESLPTLAALIDSKR